LRILRRFLLRRRLTYVIPTLNGETRLPGLLGRICGCGASVIVAVDSRTTDRSAEIARGFRAQVHVVDNPHGYLEPMIEAISRLARTPWVLRLDDDELPTRMLVEWVEHRLLWRPFASDVYAFRRIWCRRNARGGLEAPGDPPYSDSGDDRQYRLYRPDRVSYHGRLHSPGIDFDRHEFAPRDAAILHLDWVYSTYERRKRKLEFYNGILPGAAAEFAAHYLPEEHFREKDFVGVADLAY
jgi:hypothetical protein